MASTVPAAKAAIRVLIETNTWPGVAPAFRWGAPTEGEDVPKTGELVYFDGTEVAEDESVMGATRIDESYSVRIVIEVRLEGDDEFAAEARSWDLYDSLRHALKQLPQGMLLDQPGVMQVRLAAGGNRRVRQANAPSAPQQWISRIVVDQDCDGSVYTP